MEEVVHTRGTPQGRELLDKRRILPDQEKKSFVATQMWDQYQEIARRKALGQKNVDIANEMNLAKETVSYIVNSPLIRQHIDSLQLRADADTVNVAKRIKNLAPTALNVLEKIIRDGKLDGENIPARVRAQHAENLLDRAGHAAPKEVRAHHLHGHYTTEDIEKIKQRALGRAIEAQVIEAEVLTDENI